VLTISINKILQPKEIKVKLWKNPVNTEKTFSKYYTKEFIFYLYVVCSLTIGILKPLPFWLWLKVFVFVVVLGRLMEMVLYILLYFMINCTISL